MSTKAEKYLAEAKRYKKLAKRYNQLAAMKKTQVISSAGIKFEKSASPKTRKIDGEVNPRHQMKGKQKVYKTSRPLI